MTRLWGLERFPISFFGDEAIQSVTAADLVAHGFRDHYGTLLPTYFENGGSFNLGVSVYAQVLPHELFGYSITVTRATSVLVALTGVAAVALILRDALHVRAWWAGALVLGITPAWFLHSRTAFETVLGVSFYAWFLHCYLRYRSDRSELWLYWAVAAGALTFYSYSPMQVVVVATALLLIASDARYHRERLGSLVGALALAAVLALPHVRFLLEHGFDATRHLQRLDSYLVDPGLGARDKVGRFLEEYRQGLSPGYWYDPDDGQDLVRHRMKGYGHMLLATLPFLVAGLAVCIYRFRSHAHRALLISLLCAPIGGALAATQATRSLAVVVPAALLTAVGLDLALRLVRRRVPWQYVAGMAVAALGGMQLFMLHDALANAPTWYDNYGLYGMQYGSRDVGAAVRRHLELVPRGRVVVSPTWANNTSHVVRLVADDDPRVVTDSIQSWRFERRPIPRGLVFLVTSEEYAVVRNDPRFTDVQVLETLRYPDGRPGFYVLRVRYSPAADTIFAREKAARSRPVSESVLVSGQPAVVTHPQLSLGRIVDVFDGEERTPVRSLQANPFVLRVSFATGLAATGLEVDLASMQPALEVTVWEVGSDSPLVLRRELTELTLAPRFSIPFGGRLNIAAAEISVRDVRRPTDAQVHIAEVRFQP